jgi:hypothetical protein
MINILFKYYSNFAAVALASGIIAFKLAILVASDGCVLMNSGGD